MSEKFHFNPVTGKSSVCTATIRACTFGSADTHGNTREHAQAKYEAKMANSAPPVTLSKKEEKARAKELSRGIPNPEAAQKAIEIARSNAAGGHDSRPNRQRSRSDAKGASIRDQLK